MKKLIKKRRINKTLIISVFIISFFLGWFSAQDEQLIYFKETENALVTQVIDGDTIVIEGGERVRLLGIDTHEKGEDYYDEAKEFLEGRILMKEVELEKSVENKDGYNRLLRYVWLNGSLINIELIEEGLAKAYFYNDEEQYKEIIAEAEKKAIDKKTGLWKNI